MKILGSLCVLVLILLVVEGRRGRHHHHHRHHGGHHHSNRQPCEIHVQNCTSSKPFCVEYINTCSDPANVTYTVSHCKRNGTRYQQNCGSCSRSQYCVSDGRSSTPVYSCRDMMLNVQPIDTSQPLCNRKNRHHRNKGRRHRHHKKGRRFGRMINEDFDEIFSD